MTDLEMTRLAAEAMGLKFVVHGTLGGYVELTHFERNGVMYQIPPNSGPPVTYRPLLDDAHAMALVKRLTLNLTILSGEWEAESIYHNTSVRAYSEDLNRAIVEVVAKMQKARTK